MDPLLTMALVLLVVACVVFRAVYLYICERFLGSALWSLVATVTTSVAILVLERMYDAPVRELFEASQRMVILITIAVLLCFFLLSGYRFIAQLAHISQDQSRDDVN